MKKLFLLVLFAAGAIQLHAQDIIGSWAGEIHISGIGLHLVFNVSKTSDTGYSATFDSPDQKAFGIPCSGIRLTNDSVFINLKKFRINYSGSWSGKDSLNGIFQQGSSKFPLGMKRITKAEKKMMAAGPVRPQTPKKPYGYYSEDVEYDNADKTLHYGATFTRPDGEGKYPAVIIISGSGTQDRNGTMLGHQPYWVLADYLTKNGIAVLRVDDRGAGKSTLGPNNSKNATSLDFSYDVEASLNYLETRPDVDKKHLGLIGHSEGGIIAPMVAARRKDVSFIVMWGAPEVGGAAINVEQNVYLLKHQGVDTIAANAFGQLHSQILSLFASSMDEAALDKQIDPVFDAWKSHQTDQTLKALAVKGHSILGADIYKMYSSLYNVAWWRFMIAYQPETDLAKVKCAVLAINGEKDTQVDAKANLNKIKAVLTRNHNRHFEVVAIPGLNHLLQTAQTGDVSEYEKISETMSPTAMKIISDWIKLHTK